MPSDFVIYIGGAFFKEFRIKIINWTQIFAFHNRYLKFIFIYNYASFLYDFQMKSTLSFMGKIYVKETVVIKSQFFSAGKKGYKCTLQGNGRRTDASGGRGVVLEVGCCTPPRSIFYNMAGGWQAG